MCHIYWVKLYTGLNPQCALRRSGVQFPEQPQLITNPSTYKPHFPNIKTSLQVQQSGYLHFQNCNVTTGLLIVLYTLVIIFLITLHSILILLSILCSSVTVLVSCGLKYFATAAGNVAYWILYRLLCVLVRATLGFPRLLCSLVYDITSPNSMVTITLCKWRHKTYFHSYYRARSVSEITSPFSIDTTGLGLWVKSQARFP